MMHAIRRPALAAAVLALASCGPRSPASAPLGIHGENDLLLVDADAANVPAALRPLLDAVGNAQTACTVTHVGGGYALTAGHCVDTDDACRNLRVFFGDRAGISPYMIASCTSRVVTVSDGTRDVSLIKIAPVPRAKVAIEWQAQPLGKALTLFSHPELAPLTWSQDCTLLKADGPVIKHDCDTLGGSSGAAVLTRDTGKMIGVHNTSDGSTTALNATAVATYRAKLEAGGVAAAPDFTERSWNEGNTGRLWRLVSLAATQSEADAACASLGKGWQPPTEQEIESARTHGMRDPGVNTAFGWAMTLLDLAWAYTEDGRLGAYTLTTNHSDMTRPAATCVRQ